MKTVIVANPNAEHQRAWGQSFANGLERHGIAASVQDAAAPCDLLVLWGVRNIAAIKDQKERGGDVCIIERGYLGDRFKWSSVSFGGKLNGRAEFRGVQKDSARFNRNFLHLMDEWQRRKGYALLIGQVPGDMSIAGVNMHRWYVDIAAELKTAEYEVRYRHHPVATDRGFQGREIPGAPAIGGTLKEAFSGAALVVTFNSNTAVESVLAGIPTVATDRGSMAWDVSGHAPGDVLTPQRMAWASELAWKQWTLEEMSSGECWARVGEVHA